MKHTAPNFDCTQKGTSHEKEGVYLLGFEFDGTACFRKGTALGPDAIRNASIGIESYSPYLNLDIEDFSNIYDLGNLPVESWQDAVDYFDQNFSLTHNRKFLMIGGEHSISYAPLKKYLDYFPELLVIHLDAHADLRDGFEGHHYSHASIIRRVLEHFGDNNSLVQYGIRSGTKEEFSWMDEHKTLIPSLDKLLEFIEQTPKERPIYLTLDLDYFDPAFLPGTGTPEAGGEDFSSFIKIIKQLKVKNLVGADIVELAPNIDPTGNSSVFAAQITRELLLTLSSSGTFNYE